MNVEDLSPETTIYVTRSNSGAGSPVHLDPQCRYVALARHVFEKTARVMHGDRDVCGVCGPSVDSAGDGRAVP